MTNSNPYQSPSSESPPTRGRNRNAGGPVLMFGTTCFLLIVVLQFVDLNLGVNVVCALGLALVGAVSVGTAFSIYRSAS